MQLAELIAGLSEPMAYPFSVDVVDVRQTHISAVFLAGEYVYKVKKPVTLGFLDFSTLELRRHFCEEEVRLNRRLAPAVYRGVVAVARSADGRVRFEGEGEVIEWAVKMQRLPERASLVSHLERDELDPTLLRAFAQRLAEFHRRAEGGAHVAESARFEVVARNARENFAESVSQVGMVVSRNVFDRARFLTDATRARLRPLIESRAARGLPRDTHGDLRLDHIYSFPQRPPPDDIVAIDCIEFAATYRHADPVADAAFLAMDLRFRGRRDLAEEFVASYLRASGDSEGAALFPLYTAYRAAVRAKVEGMELSELEIPENERNAARIRARAHWLLALDSLEEPGQRPCLVLVAGLPGTGKSTLARGLAERGGYAVVRSDVVRKELAGRVPQVSAGGELDAGLYSPEWTERTYAECLRRAEALLADGGRVIVDANFGDEARRRAFLDAADRLAVPALFLWCRAAPEVAKRRVDARRGDASDATTAVYDRAAALWQAFGAATHRVARVVNAHDTPEAALAHGLDLLREARLVG